MIPQADGSLLARVDIQFKGIRQSFTTRNLHEPSTRIAMRLHEGPFKSLEGEWQFQPITDEACRIEFFLEYHFSSGLLERVVRPVFDQIASSFVDAFVSQAELQHGQANH
jgi:ribosome-associated toxin RatA of RatAB toxin-antitoxin module